MEWTAIFLSSDLPKLHFRRVGAIQGDHGVQFLLAQLYVRRVQYNQGYGAILENFLASLFLVTMSSENRKLHFDTLQLHAGQVRTL
jgi:hypothetical protein